MSVRHVYTWSAKVANVKDPTILIDYFAAAGHVARVLEAHASFEGDNQEAELTLIRLSDPGSGGVAADGPLQHSPGDNAPKGTSEVATDDPAAFPTPPTVATGERKGYQFAQSTGGWDLWLGDDNEIIVVPDGGVGIQLVTALTTKVNAIVELTIEEIW